MGDYTVEDLYKKRKLLGLYLLNGPSGLKRRLISSGIHRPGLALTGFIERFPQNRVQVLGETEITYLRQKPAEETKAVLRRIFATELPCVIVTKGLEPPPVLLEVATEHEIPVLGTSLSTTEFVQKASFWLDHLFAPQTTIHGTLVDVYGIGLLYTGKSGIGKSECALDLVERGHRLVADDVVKVIKIAPGVIVGRGGKLLGHRMEIRGVGIIDIEKLFGIRAIRGQKRIEVEVRLVYWEERGEYERLGLEENYTTILGVRIPLVTIPISPGKNITVISEVVAMNHILRIYGHDSAMLFRQKLTEEIQRKSESEEYLGTDYE